MGIRGDIDRDASLSVSPETPIAAPILAVSVEISVGWYDDCDASIVAAFVPARALPIITMP